MDFTVSEKMQTILCMRWIGICNRVFDLMCVRARDRIIAPHRKLASKQIIQSWIAECAA